MQELKKGEALIHFTGTLRTRATEKHYLFLIQRYAAYRKTLDMDQIIEEDSKNQRLAVAHIREFLLSIQKTQLSPGSMANYRAALKHFYEMNDITLNWKKIGKFARMEDASTGLRQKDRAYTREEIQLMLQGSSKKVRAIILLLASSGIRVGAVRSMCLKHLTKIELENGISLYQLLIYPGHKDQYITFCTPEAAAAIDSYLNFRSRAGEKLNPDSPLFRKEFFAADLFKVRNDIVSMTTWGISGVIRLALKEAGLISSAMTIESESKAIRHDVQRNHGFRKFANTQMVLAEVNGAAKEMLLGHSIGLDDKYYRPTPRQLFDEYTKAINLLTISEENRLRRKVAAYCKTLESEKQKEDRISELENKMQSLISTLSQLREQGQVNLMAQSLYTSGVLKDGQ
jgi:integrase